MTNHPSKGFNLTLVPVFLLLLFSFRGFAQETILTSSGNATGTGGTVEYSVGQTAFITVNGTTGTMTEGVQQPYEILFMTGQEDLPGVSLDCIVYPNPATTEVRLKLEDTPVTDMSYQLRNTLGEILEEKDIETKETVIPMNNQSESKTPFLTKKACQKVNGK